jgi:ATP-dependent RNA helicase DeaD
MATSLKSLNLRPELLEGCRKQGFWAATPIQAKVIPAVMKGRDVMVEAKTGSGKTLAYGLPLLNAEPLQKDFPEVLILTPTRELAVQVQGALVRTAGTLTRSVVALAGGASMDRQAAELKAGASIVVGTLGRVEELVGRKLLGLDHIRTLVLDEVDELMQGGFSRNLAELLRLLPHRRQTLLFSATISREVEDVARQFMRSPERMQLEAGRELVADLRHRILRTTVKQRAADLAALLLAERPFQALVFCGTRRETEALQDALSTLKLEAEFLHGDLSPTKRRKLIERFRQGEPPILVATDLAARGLDLPGVDLVINSSLPEGAAAYLHRAGRTGRAGKPGVVVTLLAEQQHSLFKNLQETFTFEKIELHGGKALVRPLKTREERDLQFRKLKHVKPPAPVVPARAGAAPKARRPR